ncbi:MAG: alpha/beta fold hydrolase [Salinisphaera sp.]|jgi:3-oxoadipate enol-lactonase/4-carboxymuconolactone decarboxylase|nr:alpha/beta fold hydrolase [Salinisphaera sp.]
MPFIDIHNRAVAYRDTGPRTAAVLLLAHPLGLSQAVWDECAALLAKRFRLISWDLPGHGASAPAAGAITAEDLAREAVALLDALGVAQAHAVGTSIGGVVVQALLTVAPDRIASAVLTNTGAIIGSREAWSERASRVRAEGLPALAKELSSRWFAPAFVASQPATLSGWQTQLARTDSESYARCCELLGAADFRGRLAAYDRPIQLVAGAEDASTPPAVLQALAGEFPQATLTVFEDVGHVTSVEAPEALAALLMQAQSAASTLSGAYEDGLAVRKSVLGAGHVERASASATTLDAPFQDMITRMAWGELWGNPDLSHGERSMITLAILAALGRDGELVLHLKTARRIGLSEAQLRQALMHVAIYAGVPAANHAFKLAKENGWGVPL